MTHAEARELAEEVRAGRCRSYVQAARDLASYLLDPPPPLAADVHAPRCEGAPGAGLPCACGAYP